LEILTFLKEKHAFNWSGDGQNPTVVMQYVNVPYDRFKKYVDYLVRQGFVEWTSENKLALLSKSTKLLGYPELADLTRGEDETP